MKALIKQAFKFGLVGGLCFILEYIIGIVCMNIFTRAFGIEFALATTISSVIGFIICCIINYFLSFKFVFERKEELNRKVEFIAFFSLSVIGLMLNTFLMWLVAGPIYESNVWLQENAGYNLVYTIAKVFAAAVVMVYNFVTRKIFLENKKGKKTVEETK